MCSLLLDYFSRHILLIRVQNTCCPIPDSKKEREHKNKPETHSKERGKKQENDTGNISGKTSSSSIHRLSVWSCLNRRGWFTSGCPQNKTLLRKHHHQQPRQRARRRRRRRRDEGKSRHLHFNNQFSPPSEQVEVRSLHNRCKAVIYLHISKIY